MTAVWVILEVIGYFIIGAFFCGLLNEDENMFVYCLWPCIPILYIIGALCVFPEKLGAAIRRAICNRKENKK